jgi:type IX secretion system PorP/SprF family membrane protein
MYLSPSEVGNFDADFRITGNYRSQWKSVTVPFQTAAIGIDHRLKNKQNIGIGLQYFNDKVGDGKLTTNEIILAGSYAFKLPNLPATIRPGVQFGFQSRSLNPSALTFNNQFINGTFDPTVASGEGTISARTFALNTGLGVSGNYIFNNNNTTELTLGFFNLNRPNQGFFNETIKREIRRNFFIQHTYQYSKILHFIPAIQFSGQGSYKEFILGSQIKYILVDRMGIYRAAYGGLWFRNRDAIYLSFGFDYQNWKMGLSYDFNVSQLTPASNVRGGLELSVRYLIFTIKAKKINHRVCPDYI